MRKPQKNAAAVSLGKRRWEGKSKAERKAHAQMMVDRRNTLILAGKQALDKR